MFLKSHKQQAQALSVVVEPGPGDNLLSDLEVLSSAARPADRAITPKGLRNLADEQHQELARCLNQPLHATQRLAEHFHPEMGGVGSEHAILRLQEQGHSIRGIARAMQLSRGAIRPRIALYHTLGRLPEPAPIHNSC